MIFLILAALLAHSGRTDSQGGHWNRRTGSYHFHDGEYAGRQRTSLSSHENDNPPVDGIKPERPLSVGRDEQNGWKTFVPLVLLVLFAIASYAEKR